MKSLTTGGQAILSRLRGNLDRLRAIDGYTGLIAFGSAVEKQLSRPPKDIDLILLVNSEVVGQGKFTFIELEADIFLRTTRLCISEILAKRSLFDVRNIAPGILVDWVHPVAPLIKKAAEVSWRDGPPRPTQVEWLLLKERWHAWSQFPESFSRLPELCRQLPARLLVTQAAVWDYHAIFGLHMTKWSYLMPRMAALDSDFHALIVACLALDSEDSDQAVRDLAERMLDILGGPPPTTWVMSDEALRPNNCEPSDERLRDSVARFPLAIQSLVSDDTIALIEGGSATRPLLMIVDSKGEKRERGAFDQGDRRWAVERGNLMDALRSAVDVIRRGRDHRMAHCRILWARDDSTEVLRRVLDDKCGEPAKSSTPQEIVFLRREPASILKQIRELEGTNRSPEALYVTGVLIRKCLQAWFRIRGYANPEDDIEAFEYVTKTDREFSDILTRVTSEFGDGSVSLGAGLETIVDHVLAPVGGPIVGDWCYPPDLWKRLGLEEKAAGQ